MNNTETVEFFQKEDNFRVLTRFSQELEPTPAIQQSDLDVRPHLREFFQALIANPAAFDKNCIHSIQYSGKNFIIRLQNFSAVRDQPNKHDDLIDIFVMAYRFLCEIDFAQPAELPLELDRIKYFTQNNLSKFSESHRQKILYANIFMPIEVAKGIIHSPVIDNLKKLSESVGRAEQLKRKFDAEFEAKHQEIERLQSELDRIETGYNFVGLVDGFKNIASVKEREKSWSFWTLVALGILMAAAPTAVEFLLVPRINNPGDLIYLLPPFFALEMIFIYFFRVVLFNFRSVTTQILQIDLRISLCQFIQSYSEYSSKIKKQDAQALEKFENIIFSGIVSEGASLPSAFDGVEQIASLVKSIRAGK